MSNFFYIDNVITQNIAIKKDLNIGATPNQFKRTLFEKDFPFPTICYLKTKDNKKKILMRKSWNRRIKKGEKIMFVSYPKADPGTTALIVSIAISVIIGVGTYLLTPRPNLNYNQIDKGASPTYDLNNQGNKIRLNQPIPVHYGRIRAYPDVASNAYTISDSNNNRIFHTLLNMGWGYIEIEDMRIDDTDLSTLSFVETNIRYPGDAPTDIFPRPMVIAKEVRNVVVTNTTDYYVLNDFLSPVKYLYFDFVAPEGLYATNITINNKPNAEVAIDFDVDISAPLNGGFFNGVLLSSGSLALLFGQANQAENGLYVFDTPTTPMVRHSTMDSASEFDSAVVKITGGDTLYNGESFMQTNTVTTVGTDPVYFSTFNVSGDIYSWSIFLRVTVQEIDSAGADVGSPIDNDYVMSASNTRPYYKSFSYTHPTEGRFKVTVHYYVNPKGSGILTFTSYSNYHDKLEWIGLRGEPDHAEQTQPKRTMIEIAVQANEKLNDSNIGIFNMLGIRRLWVYDFGTDTWSETSTTSPIWAFWDMATSSRQDLEMNYGVNLDESYLDLQNMSDIQDSIEDLSLECNARFDTALSAMECLQQIVQSMRCIVYPLGGKILLARHEEKSSISGFFTPANSDGISYEPIPIDEFTPTWMRVTYFDEDTNKKETVDCVIAGDDNTAIVEEVELHTITNRTKAWQEGMHLLAQNLYMREKITISTDMEGFLPIPCDHISISDPLIGTTQTGYVQKVDGDIIYLSEPVDFMGYANGIIRFKNLNGSSSGEYVCSVGATPYQVVMVPFTTNALDYTAFDYIPQEDESDVEATSFIFGVNGTVICAVIQINPSGNNKCTIESVIHDPRVHTVDKAIHRVPDYDDDLSTADWEAMICDAVDCVVDVATKLVTVRFNGSGYNSFLVKYLFDDAGTEHLETNTVPYVSAGVYTDTYTYTYATPPSRVTVTPIIDVTISPPVTETLDSLVVIVPIELA